MRRRYGRAQPSTHRYGERAAESPCGGCGLGKRPELAVWHHPYLKPNPGCALQSLGTRSVRCSAGPLGRSMRRFEWKV